MHLQIGLHEYDRANIIFYRALNTSGHLITKAFPKAALNRTPAVISHIRDYTDTKLEYMTQIGNVMLAAHFDFAKSYHGKPNARTR